MPIIPGKQVAALEPASTTYTTSVLETDSVVTANKEDDQVITIAGKSTERVFVRNIRVSRSASQYNSSSYGNYNGSQGYSIRLELWSWVSDSYDYTTATVDTDGPNLLAWQQTDTTSYDASTASLVIDFPFSHWFGPTFPDVASSSVKFAVVIYDTSGASLDNDTTRYDVKIEYDKIRSI
jgi:hypothetical protein